MADEEGKTEEGEKKGGSKKLILIVIVLVVLIGGGVGAFLALGSGGGDGEDGEAEEFEELEGGEGGILPSAVLPLETFIVNLQVKGSFLKTTLQLEFAEPELPPTIESDIPKIRDSIIRTLSTKSSAEILSIEGKEKPREQIRDEINEVLGAEDVTQVFFTEFIVQ